MDISSLNADGLLPAGIHQAEPDDLLAFADPSMGDAVLRRAVALALQAWMSMARRGFGPGVCWIGGGFVCSSEPSDTAIVAWHPNDSRAALDALERGTGVDLLSLTNVIYSYPDPGGGLVDRWPVSALVDAHLMDRTTAGAFRSVLSRSLGRDGHPVRGLQKGFLEVVLGD